MEKDKILLKRIAKQIKKYRKINNFTQGDLAQRVEVHKNTIKNFEKEATVPDIKILLKIAEVFGIPISSLFEDEEKVKYPLLEKFVINNKSPLSKENIEKNLSISNVFPKGLQYYLLKVKENYFLIDTTQTQIQDEMLYAVLLTEKKEIVLRQIKKWEPFVILFSSIHDIEFFKRTDLQIIGKIVRVIKIK